MTVTYPFRVALALVGFFTACFRDTDFVVFAFTFVVGLGFNGRFNAGSFAFTASAAVFSFLAVPDDTSVFP